MSIFRKFIKLIFRCKQKQIKIVDKANYELIPNVNWITCSKGLSSWNHAAGLEADYLDYSDEYITRLYCRASGDSYQTAAIKTPIGYVDGKFECEVRFESGKGTWPAIWCSCMDGSKDYSTYYEVDLSEYYETRNNTETTYHCPESMQDSNKHYYKNVKTKISPKEWTKFAMTWDDKAIKVYINNKNVMTINNDGNPKHFPIDSKNRIFRFILSMQYNNKYLSKIDLTELPLWMDIKNIKIYKKL